MRLRLGFNSQGEKILFDSDEQVHNQFSHHGQDNAVGAQEFDDALSRAFLEVVGELEIHPQTRACIQLPNGKKLELRLIR